MWTPTASSASAKAEGNKLPPETGMPGAEPSFRQRALAAVKKNHSPPTLDFFAPGVTRTFNKRASSLARLRNAGSASWLPSAEEFALPFFGKDLEDLAQPPFPADLGV